MEDNKKTIEEIKNKELVDAIRAMIIDDSDDNRKKMFEEVAKAQFIAPIAFIDDEEVVYGQEHARKINFEVMKNGDGKVMFPVFTDIEELKKVKKEGKVDTVITNANNYAQMFADPKCSSEINGVVINPMGMSLMIDKDYFLNLSKQRVGNGGMTQRKFDKDTKFTFTIPKEQPVAMLEALKEYFKFRQDVNKAYFLMMAVNDEDSNMLLVVDTADQNPQNAFEGIMKIVAPFNNGRDVAMVPYNNEFGKKATEKIQPFYSK